MKPSEYGGQDTAATHGIQPAPNLVLKESDELRLMYATDPADEASIPAIDMKRGTPPNYGPPTVP